MTKTWRLGALCAVVGIAAGCASQQQQLAQRQDGAVQTALQRGRFDLNCPAATATVLSQDYIQPAIQGPWVNGLTRLEYTVGVAGCNQRTTYRRDLSGRDGDVFRSKPRLALPAAVATTPDRSGQAERATDALSADPARLARDHQTGRADPRGAGTPRAAPRREHAAGGGAAQGAVAATSVRPRCTSRSAACSQSLASEARLNLMGRVAAREDLTRMLSNRLRLERDRHLHPEIAAEEIRRPLFIAGLPRSGSTLLYNLLAQDPANRVPLNWETMYPSPPPERATHETDPRGAQADRQIRWFGRLQPEFRKIHPVAARLPEECVVILSHTFYSFQFSSMYFVPSYQSWLERQDLRPAYHFHRRFLQHLQWRCRAERWVLKAPPHLPALDALFAVYPDAGLILTHRDPLEVVASVASLHAVLRSAFSDAVEPAAVGPEVSRMLADDIARGMQALDRRLRAAGPRAERLVHRPAPRSARHRAADLRAFRSAVAPRGGGAHAPIPARQRAGRRTGVTSTHSRSSGSMPRPNDSATVPTANGSACGERG